MKIYQYLLATALCLILSSYSMTEIDDRIVVFSKVMEIEAVQKIVLENNKTVVSNGLIGSDVNVFIDETAVNIEASETSNHDLLTIRKYDVKQSTAKILMTKDNVRVKVKLNKDEGEWKITSYYIKNEGSVSISLDF